MAAERRRKMGMRRKKAEEEVEKDFLHLSNFKKGGGSGRRGRKLIFTFFEVLVCRYVLQISTGERLNIFMSDIS